ncbi:orotate phosphoribosyltransferase [Acrasis kona]|uniref:Orotate phosphoribosyltransferase n=1 Tax=Acrasis kona TaxID=1008807 RepID=A0AAW2ZEC8_9EUKA
MSLTPQDRTDRAKRSTTVKYSPDIAPKELYDEVARGIASNVKMGPFTATSGVILPYYLNASTNFLDKDVSPKIVELMGHYVDKIIKPVLPVSEEPSLCVGMEVAGGVSRILEC